MATGPNSVVLKFNSDFYKQKAEILANYADRLETHLKTLESLKDQLASQDFWTGDEAADYLTQLIKQINAVRNAHDNIRRSRTSWAESRAEIERQKLLMSVQISDIKGMIDSLGIE